MSLVFHSSDNTFATPTAGQTVYSYKYLSETRENTKYGGQPTANGYTKPAYQEQLSLRQSPFPRDESDAPGPQSPPKRLDDLMASFGDRSEYVSNYSREYRRDDVGTGYQSKAREPEKAEYTIPIKKPQPENEVGPQKLVEVKEPEVTRSSAAGPPVFYPPGSTTFVKKEDVMHQVYRGRAVPIKQYLNRFNRLRFYRIFNLFIIFPHTTYKFFKYEIRFMYRRQT